MATKSVFIIVVVIVTHVFCTKITQWPKTIVVVMVLHKPSKWIGVMRVKQCRKPPIWDELDWVICWDHTMISVTIYFYLTDLLNNRLVNIKTIGVLTNKIVQVWPISTAGAKAMVDEHIGWLYAGMLPKNRWVKA